MRGHADSVTGLSLSSEGSYLLSNAMDNTGTPCLRRERGRQALRSYASFAWRYGRDSLEKQEPGVGWAGGRSAPGIKLEFWLLQQCQLHPLLGQSGLSRLAKGSEDVPCSTGGSRGQLNVWSGSCRGGLAASSQRGATARLPTGLPAAAGRSAKLS